MGLFAPCMLVLAVARLTLGELPEPPWLVTKSCYLRVRHGHKHFHACYCQTRNPGARSNIPSHHDSGMDGTLGQKGRVTKEESQAGLLLFGLRTISAEKTMTQEALSSHAQGGGMEAAAQQQGYSECCRIRHAGMRPKVSKMHQNGEPGRATRVYRQR